MGWEGGRQFGQVTPRESMKFKINNRRKFNIIKGVAISGQDAPHPPLPSTIRFTARGVISLAPGPSDVVRGGQTIIGQVQGWPVKVHC